MRCSLPATDRRRDGNHEDHQWLQWAIESGADETWRSRLQLFYQRRPSIARIGGATVGLIGGALGVDRPQRHNRAAGLPNYILRRRSDEESAGGPVVNASVSVSQITGRIPTTRVAIESDSAFGVAIPRRLSSGTREGHTRPRQIVP